MRRHPTLVAYLLERSAELSDLALEMHDRMVGSLMNKAEKMRDEGFRKHGKAINEKVGLYAGSGRLSSRGTRERQGSVYGTGGGAALGESPAWRKLRSSRCHRASTTWASSRPGTPT